MRTGSVIVDMAAANGGNVALTRTDERVVTDNVVTILGYTDLAGRLAAQTSQLYGTNIVNLLKLLTPGKDGELVLDLEDVVAARHHRGPRRRVAVAAAAGPGERGAGRRSCRRVRPRHGTPPRSAARPAPEVVRRRAGRRALRARWRRTHRPSFLGHFTVFALAVFVGYYVISNVAHALHTPLMSETNAISGIILVGGILQVGSDNLAVTVLALVAVLVASINIFGGFLVTLRMLEMFRKD